MIYDASLFSHIADAAGYGQIAPSESWKGSKLDLRTKLGKVENFGLVVGQRCGAFFVLKLCVATMHDRCAIT